MKYKIGIDLTYIIEDEVTGIRKYGEEIIDGLSKINEDYEITIIVKENLKEAFKAKFPKHKIVTTKLYLKNSRYFRKTNILSIIKTSQKRLIEKQNCDLIIYPYVNKYVSIIEKPKKIISILDIIPLDEMKDKTSSKYQKIKEEYLNIMKQTETIVTISEYSKRRLMDINPEFKGEIIVIPSSVEKPKKSNKKISEVLDEDKPYIFSINSFFKHKNQITLVKAFNMIKDKISHNLILVGRPELSSPISAYKEVIEYIEVNNLKDRVKVLSYISDVDRNTLFYNTDLFVTTSMQEGFGRTPVEAAICKVPVISTRETSLPEATMNEVFYYENPVDEKELAEKIMYVLENRPTDERLEEISEKLEKTYSEEEIARKYQDLIREIMEG